MNLAVQTQNTYGIVHANPIEFSHHQIVFFFDDDRWSSQSLVVVLAGAECQC